MDAAIIAWTIRIAMLCFVVSIIGFTLSRYDRPHSVATRILWSLGFVSCLLHMLAAFHFHYQWSHAAAVAETARQTREAIGIEVGFGVFFNYLFLACWGMDAAWLWLAPRDLQIRAERVRFVWLCYLVFIAFNGTIVFKAGWIRAAGIAACTMLVGAIFVKLYRLKRVKLRPSY